MTPLPRLEIVDGPHYSSRDPFDDGRTWGHYAYKLRLRFDGRQMTLPYFMGDGHTDGPSIGDVMSSLLSDASTAENIGPADVWEFAAEFGYEINDEASYERTRATLRQIHSQTDALARVIGRRRMIALLDDEDATYGSDERFAAAWARIE